MKTIKFSPFSLFKCEQHGINDFSPCPWPDCKNGIPEAEFNFDKYIQDEKIDTYERKGWLSPENERYYTWSKKEWPNWFSCKGVLWSEANRKKVIERSLIDKVYHYTSIEGLMGILKTGSIWLSDYQYLNDKREVNHGVDVIKNAAKKILSKSNNPVINELLETWISDLDDIKDRIYIASFSADGDSLSQWRAYGSVAIGFRITDISQHINSLQVKAVEYNADAQNKLAEIYLNHLCQAYNEDKSQNLLEKIPDVYHRINQLVELIAFFKDTSFMDEREYRGVYIEDQSIIDSLGLDKPKKNFRATKNLIVPYINSNNIHPLNGHENPLIIDDIILGPSCDNMLERGIREFISELGLNEVNIKKSNIPYRT